MMKRLARALATACLLSGPAHAAPRSPHIPAAVPGHVWGGAGSHTYIVPSAAAATLSHPFAVAAFNPSAGDLLDLTKIDANPATKAIDAWMLEGDGKLHGHAGQCILTQKANGIWALLGDRSGDGQPDVEVDLHAVGSQTTWADVASHILL